ncbi:SDR family NAD(P)-dependent oxidoreductase [Hoeflea olei]|uniref:Cyclopentanol dehydrogenase n=1 Tax=Hoeflea olei TaxID=1480615 RepID=A0A1C1YRA4_9HYPH|nr:SDR family NAD(P)-dependent oxidoreductase [Hoeflea olei]OCW56014.1 cyclopentanol dehydrogenase [Hoeflea olei]
MIELVGKTAIVTGGARGQGAWEVRKLSEAGAAVIIADILEQESKSLASGLAAEGRQVRFCALDVASPDQWQSVVEEMEAWQGRLDILVNNAGIVNRKSIIQMDLETWNRVISINQTGVFLGQKAVADLMRRSGGGSIINIASNSAFTAHQDPAYTASKWAVRGLTRSAASEFAAWNIRANAICPGLVVTDLNRGAPHLQPMIAATPSGRAVEAEEVANLVLFLASDLATSITGEDILIDGGFSALSAYRGVQQAGKTAV